MFSTQLTFRLLLDWVPVGLPFTSASVHLWESNHWGQKSLSADQSVQEDLIRWLKQNPFHAHWKTIKEMWMKKSQNRPFWKPLNTYVVFFRCLLPRGLTQPWDLPRSYLVTSTCSPRSSCLSGCVWHWEEELPKPSPSTKLQQVHSN